MDRLAIGSRIADELLEEIEGSRLVALAKSIIMHITRTMYSRMPHLAMVATDPSVMAAAGNPEPSTIAAATLRLRLFTRTTGQYPPASIVSIEGRPIASNDADRASDFDDIGASGLFRRALANSGVDEWFADEIRRSPELANRTTLLLAKESKAYRMTVSPALALAVRLATADG